MSTYAAGDGCRGPMVSGLAPRDASDRLNIYQLYFDDLWRSFQTFSGGERLFGMEVSPVVYKSFQKKYFKTLKSLKRGKILKKTFKNVV